ncbi:MAG: hypothetical protein ACLGI6_05710 [Gammaproteobacteria bacterium]
MSRAYIDPRVRAQDDFFQHLSGKWLQQAEIPADKPFLDGFMQVMITMEPQLKALLEETAGADNPPGSDAQKIGDHYASFMDEATIERLGIAPLQPELDRIAAVSDKAALPALFAHLNRIGVKLPYGVAIHQDAKESTRYVADLVQDGLGLPDRDYYLKQNDGKLAATRKRYNEHLARILGLAAVPDAAAARAVLASSGPTWTTATPPRPTTRSRSRR